MPFDSATYQPSNAEEIRILDDMEALLAIPT